MHTFIPYSLSVCATITIKMASRLTDKVFLNSAVTLTSKFQGQMINCLCLRNAGTNLHETKAMWMNWLIYFIYDHGHWPCLWPCPLISKVKSWNCHIYEISDLIAKKNLRRVNSLDVGWFDILLIISDLRFAFIVCCLADQVWCLCRQQHQYDYIPITTAIVCI